MHTAKAPQIHTHTHTSTSAPCGMWFIPLKYRTPQNGDGGEGVDHLCQLSPTKQRGIGYWEVEQCESPDDEAVWRTTTKKDCAAFAPMEEYNLVLDSRLPSTDACTAMRRQPQHLTIITPSVLYFREHVSHRLCSIVHHRKIYFFSKE